MDTQISPTSASFALMEMIGQGLFAQAIYTAGELGIADACIDGPKNPVEIAFATGTDSDAVHRLLRLLSSRGIFDALPDGRFDLNDLSEPLRSDAEIPVRTWAKFMCSPEHREHWSYLPDVIRTGDAAVPSLRGMSFFEYTEQNSEFGLVYDKAMATTAGLTEAGILDAFDFGRYATVVDVGGGRGTLLDRILQQSPRSSGILFDLPSVISNVESSRQLDNRRKLVAGSFFDSVPTGGDLYVLKHILHDWNDDDAARILQSVREAVPHNGRLLVVELTLPESNQPSIGFLTDLNLLTMFGGRERTGESYRSLLEKAGFAVDRITPAVGIVSLIEAIPT